MSDRVDEYIASLFARDDDLLSELREAADREGLPPISISAATGRLLQVLLTAVRAERVLEVGTLGGYSAIWMARALSETGRLISVEISEDHAAFARRFVARAGLAEKVDIRVGRALDVLPSFDGERFDVVFLDADKEPLPTYLGWATRLVRPGGLIVADNALWGGRVFDASVDDEGTRGVRQFNQRLSSDARLRGTIVPVGDGVAIAVVL
jgi:predicted O-methyltransferase YrrM